MNGSVVKKRSFIDSLPDECLALFLLGKSCMSHGFRCPVLKTRVPDFQRRPFFKDRLSLVKTVHVIGFFIPLYLLVPSYRYFIDTHLYRAGLKTWKWRRICAKNPYGKVKTRASCDCRGNGQNIVVLAIKMLCIKKWCSALQVTHFCSIFSHFPGLETTRPFRDRLKVSWSVFLPKAQVSAVLTSHFYLPQILDDRQTDRQTDRHTTRVARL